LKSNRHQMDQSEIDLISICFLQIGHPSIINDKL